MTTIRNFDKLISVMFGIREFDTAMQRIDDCLRYNGSREYRQGLVNLAMCSMAAWSLGIEDAWDEIRYPNSPADAPPIYHHA